MDYFMSERKRRQAEKKGATLSQRQDEEDEDDDEDDGASQSIIGTQTNAVVTSTPTSASLFMCHTFAARINRV